MNEKISVRLIVKEKDGTIMLPPISAYLYCESCETFCDFWKYDYNLTDAGHSKCKTRTVTQEEYQECLKECQEDGCFEEL